MSVETLAPAGDRVEVRLSDGLEASFDLVVGADGIHSRVRDLAWRRLPERDIIWVGPALAALTSPFSKGTWRTDERGGQSIGVQRGR